MAVPIAVLHCGELTGNPAPSPKGMQFKGELSPIGTSPNVMKVTLVASCICMTVVGPNGLQTPLEPALGEQVIFESDVTFLGGFESSEVTSGGEAGFKENCIPFSWDTAPEMPSNLLFF